MNEPDNYDTLFVQRGAEEAFRIAVDDVRRLRAAATKKVCDCLVIQFLNDSPEVKPIFIRWMRIKKNALLAMDGGKTP